MGPAGPPGLQGLPGEQGLPGPAGEGVPPGGTEGQLLQKESNADFDVGWLTLAGLQEVSVQPEPPPDIESVELWVDLSQSAPPGPAVPPGGTTNQVLAKASPTDFDVAWQTLTAVNGLPVGGTAGQVLSKNSSNDFDAVWSAVPPATNGVPVGGTTGQLLQKTSGTDFATGWTGPFTIPGPGATVVPATSFGLASTPGAGVAYSRADHSHGSPPAPVIPTAGATVQPSTVFGQASAVGVGTTTFARSDHVHGTPARELPAAGAAGFALVKNTATDFDVGWAQVATGEVGYASNTTAVSGITTSGIEIVGVNVNVVTGRRYKITSSIRGISSTVDGDIFTFYTLAAATNLREHIVRNVGVSIGQNGFTQIARFVAASTASVRFGLNVVRLSGSGSGTLATGTGAGQQNEIIVENVL